VSDVFFYGTHQHVPLLETVLGRCGDPLDLIPATLFDHSVYEVIGQNFPLLQSASGVNVSGFLLRSLSKSDLARIRFFHVGFGCDLHRVSVQLESGQSVSAMVFSPTPGEWPVGAPWSLDSWVDSWGPIWVRAAQEVMDHFGKLNADEIARRFPGICLRAAAWVAAQSRPGDPDHDLTRDVVVHAHHRRYSNFFAAEEMDLQYRRYDGQLSPVLNRGAQILGQAAIVLPYDPQLDSVLIVEQFRAPLFMGGDRAPWLWQPVAGLVDPGETPQEAAHREAMEEAGLTLSRLEPVAGVYSSPGANSDYLSLFIGLSDFSTRQKGGGLEEEGEDIRSSIISFSDLMQGVDQRRYRDMQLVTTALWLARHRDRLREAA